MTTEVAISEIIDYLFRSCKDYIIDNYNETDKLPYLKQYAEYYRMFKKKSVGEHDLDILLKEMLDYLEFNL